MANEPTITYTKGEWYLQKYTDAYTNIVRCKNGKHETIFIASTPQSSLPEARANAMLMSAAPDLLEALKEVIAISDRDHVAWFKAKAAIAKAEGGEYCLNQQAQAGVGFDYKSRDWEKEQAQPASEEAIRLMKERWISEGKRECPDCGVWFKSEGRCPECNPLG